MNVAVKWDGWTIRVFSGKFRVNGNSRDGHVDSQRGELVVRDPGTPEGLALNAMRVWEAARVAGVRPPPPGILCKVSPLPSRLAGYGD